MLGFLFGTIKEVQFVNLQIYFNSIGNYSKHEMIILTFVYNELISKKGYRI